MLNVTKKNAKQSVEELSRRGFGRFIAEPMIPHNPKEEHYFSIERVRGGMKVLYSPHGGVDTEKHADSIERYRNIKDVPLPKKFLEHVVEVMDKEHLSFVEINPLLVHGEDCVILDAAVLADSAGMGHSSWGEDDIADTKKKTEAEKQIHELNSSSPASFSFRVLNPEGSIWLLLSGGGASITIADEAANRGKAHLVGNYGEYSGGPTAEETQVYTEAALRQLLKSSAAKKALIIAGGVANFTDVKKTFTGVIAALEKNIEELKKIGTKVFVRRGGPNEQEGLALMESFLRQHDLLGSVHGSKTVLTKVVDEALEFADA
jgi:ATP-citrate lyase beta-subunit